MRYERMLGLDEEQLGELEYCVAELLGEPWHKRQGRPRELTGRRGLAAYSRATGVAFGAAFAGIATGSSSSAVVLPFYGAVLAAFTWLAVVSIHLYAKQNRPGPAVASPAAQNRQPS